MREYEVGPIRPPSEAESLLLRVTRNCPWNKCKFCTLYKGEKFSIRSNEDIFRDIDLVKASIDIMENNEEVSYSDLMKDIPENSEWAISSAVSFYRNGMKSVFLQDADTMIIKPDDMVEILNYLKKTFPKLERITSYGRSSSLSHISIEDMKRIADAGLNRVHMGMETGSDTALELVKKGTTKEKHILGGQRVKEAGIELSVYYMPGLGGTEYSYENAVETADAINKIDPDYIRIRTLAVSGNSLLSEDYEKNIFHRTNDTKIVQELRLMISELEGISSTVVSDHIINLIPEVNGKLPEEKEKMIAAIDWYLNLSEEDKMIYRIGRRTGIIISRKAFGNEVLRLRTERIIKKEGINHDNIDMFTDQLISRYI